MHFLEDSHYLVLPDYHPEPEKVEPVYYSGKVVCVEYPAPYGSFIVGKVYSFKNGIIIDECSDIYNDENPYETLEEFNRDSIAKFIEYRGEQS